MEKKGPKILIFIIIIALLGGAIYLILLKNGTVNVNKKENLETMNSIKYFLYLSEGYDSKYNGAEKLFEEESFTKEDLNNGIILTTAFRYIADPKNNIDTSITPTEYAAVEEDIDITDAKVIKGKIVRDAIKTLFGIDYNDRGFSSKDYKYTYAYDDKNDIYVRKEKTNSSDQNYSILPFVVTKTKKNDTIISKVAVAYVVQKDDNFEIYSNPENKELIKTVKEIDINDFTSKEIDKMAKYNITCKDIEKNYTFEKFEAVK